MSPAASDDSDSDESAVAFASIDFSGVSFDAKEEASDSDQALFAWERHLAFQIENHVPDPNLAAMVEQLRSGDYSSILRTAGSKLLSVEGLDVPDVAGDESVGSVSNFIRTRVLRHGISASDCIEMEIIGVAALNLFLQANYTGPSLEDLPAETLVDINPHACFKRILKADKDKTTTDEAKEEKMTVSAQSSSFQNAVLSELAVNGAWPSQVCQGPYFLLLARCILATLADPTAQHWLTLPVETPSTSFSASTSQLSSVGLWHARAIVAHERLLQTREPSVLLWEQADKAFSKCQMKYCPADNKSLYGSRVMLEFGLAQHHFNQVGNGRASFWKAKQLSGLQVEVTGAEGKRTKFQQKATAQMVVRATSAQQKTTDGFSQEEAVKGQMIAHTEESILLERVKFEEDKENEITSLSIIDQAILMALCLDVKNSNPADGLTNEEMAAFLARVLDHNDDWMVYSIALLERSWLEFERSHARERSILQMQALADQHTNRLTLTQSTKQSIEESAPVQERLKNLHIIVYPPRWLMLQDLADRYASLGIVSTAAELYADIEDWDDVVDCYKRAGKVSKAEQVVRERLEVQETPRMWSALGDLTNDPEHYRRAIELSNGRYADAFIALGEYFFNQGSLIDAAEQFQKSLKVRPLSPATWFRLGTISMQLGRWDTALRSFSEVVTQEPEEPDAWANVAAIHMRNKNPAEAYPALVQSLKYGRNNWKVWISKLYTCLDLEKYDEAIQACNIILDQRGESKASEGVRPLEERCVRAIVGGAIKRFHESKDDKAAADAARRTLSRAHALLDRLSTTEDVEAWVFETLSFLHEQAGNDVEVLEHLMKEYRALQAVPNWEKDDFQIKKVCDVVLRISRIQVSEGSKESLTKSRFMLRGVITKLTNANPDKIPETVEKVQKALDGVAEALSSQ